MKLTTDLKVAEAVRAVIASAQDTIRAYATDFKSTEAADVLVGQNHLIELSKALGLPEAVSNTMPMRSPTHHGG